jgi:hypothetical protein
LDIKNYYKIRQSDEIQNLLKIFLDDRTILFIGCGSELENPNFDALLKWASERHKNLSNIHCLLIRIGDTLNYRPLVRLRYGADYQDLAHTSICHFAGRSRWRSDPSWLWKNASSRFVATSLTLATCPLSRIIKDQLYLMTSAIQSALQRTLAQL